MFVSSIVLLPNRRLKLQHDEQTVMLPECEKCRKRQIGLQKQLVPNASMQLDWKEKEYTSRVTDHYNINNSRGNSYITYHHSLKMKVHSIS